MSSGNFHGYPYSQSPAEYVPAVSRGRIHKTSSSDLGGKQGPSFGSGDDRRGPQKDPIMNHYFKSGEISPSPRLQSGGGGISLFVGPEKGIEGRNNSCFMDVVLTSTFMTTMEFINTIKSGHSGSGGHRLKGMVLANLRQVSNKIQHPPNFCSFNDIQPLKDVLAQVNPRFDGQMMDVDELINIMFGLIFNLKPFIQYSVSTSNFLHQIILPPGNRKRMDYTVRSLLQESIRNQGLVGFAEVPNPALLIAMPRSNGKLVGVDAVIPNLFLDITDLCTKDPYSREVVFYLHAVICLNNLHYTAFMFDEQSKSYLYYDSMSDKNGKSQVWGCPEFEYFLEKFTIKSQNGLLTNIEGRYQRVLTDCRLCIYLPKVSEDSGPLILKPRRALSPVQSSKSNQRQQVLTNFDVSFAKKDDTTPVAPKPDRSTKPTTTAFPVPMIVPPDSRHEAYLAPSYSPDGVEESYKKDVWENSKGYEDLQSQQLSESKIAADKSKISPPPQSFQPKQLDCLGAITLGLFKLHDPFHRFVLEVDADQDWAKTLIRKAINEMRSELHQSPQNAEDAFEMLLKGLNIKRKSEAADDAYGLMKTIWKAVSPNQKFINYTKPNTSEKISKAYVHNLIWKNCTTGGSISIQEALINSLKEQELILLSVPGPGLIIFVDRSIIKRDIVPTEMLDVSKLKERKSDQTALKSSNYRLYSVICKKSDGEYAVYHREIIKTKTRIRQWVEYSSFASKTNVEMDLPEEEDNLPEPGTLESQSHDKSETTNPSYVVKNYGTIYIYVPW